MDALISTEPARPSRSFSSSTRALVVRARQLAGDCGAPVVSPLHLLAGLALEEGGVLALASAGLDEAEIADVFSEASDLAGFDAFDVAVQGRSGPDRLSPTAARSLLQAVALAAVEGLPAAPRHLLAALSKEPELRPLSHRHRLALRVRPLLPRRRPPASLVRCDARPRLEPRRRGCAWRP